MKNLTPVNIHQQNISVNRKNLSFANWMLLLHIEIQTDKMAEFLHKHLAVCSIKASSVNFK